MTLSHLPAGYLERGCRKARETCDHPSKIIPAILHELEYVLPALESNRRPLLEPRSFTPPPKLPAPEYVDPAEVRKLIQSIGNT